MALPTQSGHWAGQRIWGNLGSSHVVTDEQPETCSENAFEWTLPWTAALNPAPGEEFRAARSVHQRICGLGMVFQYGVGLLDLLKGLANK
jgi:hypothetical protein